MAKIVRATDIEIAQDPLWEDAYLRFESPQQEVEKFCKRLRRLGVDRWSRDSEVVELFCGRGGAIHAWHRLGFRRVSGVDLSERLLRCFEGEATLYAADARRLPFADASRDIIAVQGGLHHLPTLPDDLDRTLAEVRRVLKSTGHFVAVEPWLTPFLRGVHAITKQPIVRRLVPKFDAFAEMVAREADTYFAWLGKPDEVRACFERHFILQICRTSFGKIEVVGQPRSV